MTANELSRTKFESGLFDLYTETFERVQGLYLNEGTSLFETLETVTAEEASTPISLTCAPIAAQVEHIRLYLEVLVKDLRGEEAGAVDWDEIWDNVREVSVDEWETSKRRLRDTYTQLMSEMKNLDGWDKELDISAALSMLVHTAYHLGEIRQALCTIQPPALTIND